MNIEFLKKAHERVPSVPVLVNLISKREKQLIAGEKPLVMPESSEEDKVDTALREVAEGKLISEIDFDAIARAEDAKTRHSKHAALKSIFRRLMADKKKKVPAGDLTVNRRAWHDYAVLEKIECGIVLSGTEVKVARNGEASLSGSYGAVLGGELYVVQMNIPVYAFGNRFNHRPQQNRKLLVHRKEVEELRLKTEAKGLTLIPLRLYLKGGRVKLELGVCRGKALHDKRDALKKKALRRDMERGDV